MAKSKNKENTDINLEDIDLSLDGLELENIETEIEENPEEVEYEYVEVEDDEEASNDEEYEYIEIENENDETSEETPTEEIKDEIISEEDQTDSDEDLSLDDFNFDTVEEDIQQKEEEINEASNIVNIVLNEENAEEEILEEETIEEEIFKDDETDNVKIEELPENNFIKTKPETVLNDFKEISPENLIIKTLTDKSFEKIYKNSKVFNNNFGQISYSGKNTEKSIVLNEIDFEDLSCWNIIIFRRNETAIDTKNEEIKIPKEDKNSIRIANLYGPEGKAQKFYDIEKINVAKIEEDTPVQKLEAGNFFLRELSSDWGISVTDFTIVGLADKYGKAIEIPEHCDGLIVGPNKSVLYFDNIDEIIIAKSAEDRGLEEDIQKWISGNINDNMYRFDANSNSDEFIGSEENNIIHINAGYSTYGWNVVFENGIRMSLADVKEYQSRHAKLPSPSGMVIRGAKTLTFSNVEKILVYQPAQYFGYGFGNPIN